MKDIHRLYRHYCLIKSGLGIVGLGVAYLGILIGESTQCRLCEYSNSYEWWYLKRKLRNFNIKRLIKAPEKVFHIQLWVSTKGFSKIFLFGTKSVVTRHLVHSPLSYCLFGAILVKTHLQVKNQQIAGYL